MVGIGNGGHGTVSIFDGHRISWLIGRDYSFVTDFHRLRCLGTQHQRRVSIENPCLIGALC